MILMRFAISMFALCLLGVAVAHSAAHSQKENPSVNAASPVER